MKTDQEILTHIISLGQDITRIHDADLLLQKILTESRQLAGADAGSIYVKQNGSLTFSHAQNATLEKNLPCGKRLIFADFSLPVDNTSIAGYVALTGTPVNIPDVHDIPAHFPFSFDVASDRRAGYITRSVLCLPLATPQQKILGVLQLINATNENGDVVAFSSHDEPFIAHFAGTASIALERAQMTRAIILRMLRMAEMRDPKETGAHVTRVGAVAAEIYDAWASRSAVSRIDIDKNKDILRVASMMHDVGKVAISDVILKKPARLSDNEFEVMKQHTFLGARLFADSHSEFDDAAYHIALEHHERWDGTGYPGAIDVRTAGPDFMHLQQPAPTPKKGSAIHPFARIVTIADVFDALSSQRCYKAAWKEDQVLSAIRNDAGRRFDPDMVDSFFVAFDSIRNIMQQYPDASNGCRRTGGIEAVPFGPAKGSTPAPPDC